MGLLKTLKFWDSRAIIESTIETTHKSYQQAQRRSPERDCHAWLASAYLARPGYKVEPMIAFARTAFFSVVGRDAPTVLAYYFLSQETPTTIATFDAINEKLLEPVFTIVQQGRFLQHWEQANPWTAAHIPVMRELVADMIKDFEKA
ncbi:hypothetical protein [uncultured Paludibaculum sp.]|uniref:hypothetical protein n=1 Tax=uncultured Paludibaculum sp. TaxID=1765020 RepID=UPI002AAAA29F|nr:hypothetical protein [uncultured Paludibaculum sp.]